MRKTSLRTAVLALSLFALGRTADAAAFSFTTGAPDGSVGTASRPSGAGKIEIESADDFFLTQETLINSIGFTGLIPSGATTGQIVLEIYRVFPLDSGPFDNQVNTRTNSPSDVAFATRDSTAGDFTFSLAKNGPGTAGNSILNGINKKPNQTTSGEGPISGDQVTYTATLTNAFILPAGHYFFIPQVGLSAANDNFFWLSATKGPAPDLQSWIRNENLAPNWSRVGTDVLGAGAFNASFSLAGQTVPEPSTLAMLGLGLAAMMAQRVRRMLRNR